jgi:hypothetical protein
MGKIGVHSHYAPLRAEQLNPIRLQADRLSAETYAFIEKQVLPDLSWPTFRELLNQSKAKWSKPPILYTDIFPALACEAAGEDPIRAIPLAAAWLLNILAGRVFDDWQDGEGEQQAWMRDGATGAASIGLFALGAANAALSHLQVERQTLSDIFRAFGNILAMSAKAQTAKLDLRNATLERYFAHIAAKTGIVFATAAWAGARTAESSATHSTVDALYDFGMNLGMAIQIADDCADIEKSDLRRQHFTLPVVFALGQENHSRHPQLVALLKGAAQENLAEDVMSLLTEIGAIEWSLRVASVYRAKAVDALEALPEANIATLVAYATGQS